MRSPRLFCALMLLARCSDPPASDPVAPSFELREGQRLFAAYCVPCHGEKGHGDGVYLSADAPAAPPDFTAAEVRGRITADAVAARLKLTGELGEAHCPAWGHSFSSEETGSLAFFTEKLVGSDLEN